MTGDILVLISLLVAAVVLFATDWFAPELTAILLLLALSFTGLLPADEVFASFGSDVVAFLGSLFVVSQALVRTGVLERFERTLARAGERFPRRLLSLLVAATAAMSAFLSNTATVAAMLPVASGLTRRLRVSPSQLFMPVAFASILGGTLTLVGTSTNVVVSAALPDYGERTWGLFELTPAALPAVVAGLIYLLTVGRRLLPDRGREVTDLYRLREYVSEAIVPRESPWVGRTLRELRAGADLEIMVLGRIANKLVESMAPDEMLAAGDRLLVKAEQQALLRLKVRRELDLVVDHQVEAIESTGRPVHEVVLPHGSRLSGRTLRALAFGSRYRVMVVALFRRGEPMLDRISSVELRDGDVLLLQGDLTPLADLFQGGHLIMLDQPPVPTASARMWISIAAFLGFLVVGGVGLLPFPVAAMSAAAVVLLTRCLTPQQAYDAIDWGVLVLVGSLLALATAMETSGAGRYFAGLLAGAAEGLGPLGLLASFYVLTVALTQPMSNQAAALLVLPLALHTAVGLGLNPRPFAAAVTLAASCSFIAPLEPASLLVYGPGRYRFRDYFRVGLPLTVLTFALNMFMVPRIWPLETPGRQAVSEDSRGPALADSTGDASVPPALGAVCGASAVLGAKIITSIAPAQGS
jgi:di/tricarboxylate transporter